MSGMHDDIKITLTLSCQGDLEWAELIAREAIARIEGERGVDPTIPLQVDDCRFATQVSLSRVKMFPVRNGS